MNTSTYIARLIGPLFLIMGLGMVVEGDTVRALSQEFLSNLSLIYLAGMLALIAGLAIVNAHNLWVADWRILITILGWLSVIAGIIRLLFPGKVQSLGAGLISHPHAMLIGGIVVLVLGAILASAGYMPRSHTADTPKPEVRPAARPAAKPAAKTAAKAATKAPAKTAAKATAKSARAPAVRKTARKTPGKTARKTTTAARRPRSPRKRS